MSPHSLTDLAALKISADEFLAAVSETAAPPVWVVDPDDVIRFVNPAAITALGYDSADELLGRNRHETIHYKHPGGTPYPAADCPRFDSTIGMSGWLDTPLDTSVVPDAHHSACPERLAERPSSVLGCARRTGRPPSQVDVVVLP